MSIEQAEVAIVGAGPAGLSAALALARAGADVTVIDENPRPGGQIYRQPPDGITVQQPGPDAVNGQSLFAQLAATRVRFKGSACVGGCFDDRVLEIADRERTWRLAARIVIVAAGAHDRPVPVPGWTLPGVMTVGGAQTLLKAQGVLPGRRVLLAGTGPLLLVVAAQLAKGGASIAAVIDAIPARAVLPHSMALLRAWSLLSDGVRYHATLRRAGVPWLAPWILTCVEGTTAVDGAVIARADEAWRPVPGSERRLDVDSVCVGYGLVPSVELLRLMGCELRYDHRADAFLPVRSASYETTVPGVFAVGDGAAVAGVKVAVEEGTLAGLIAAHRLGHLLAADLDAHAAGPRSRLARLAPFRAAMDDVYRVRPGLYDQITPATFVCRCEEVTRGQMESAVADGASTITAVKAWTRGGMGACQARMCALPTMHLVARALGRPADAIGDYPPGPLAKPVPVTALLKDLEASRA